MKNKNILELVLSFMIGMFIGIVIFGVVLLNIDSPYYDVKENQALLLTIYTKDLVDDYNVDMDSWNKEMDYIINYFDTNHKVNSYWTKDYDNLELEVYLQDVDFFVVSSQYIYIYDSDGNMVNVSIDIVDFKIVKW